MKSILGFILLLSFAAHSQPGGRVLGPMVPTPQMERGKNLIWALMSGDSDIVASYFEDSVKVNLTKDKIQKIQSQMTWLSKLIGDSLDQLMTGYHRDSTGHKTLFFREYRLANESNKRAPLIVIHVLYKDSTTTLSSGVFVKTFLEDSEKRLASDLTWKVNGKTIDVNTVTVIHLKAGDILAIKVYDDDTTALDSATIRRKGVPIIREAIAQGFLEKTKAQLAGKPLLNGIGVAFIRRDPRFGYTQFKYGLAPKDYETKEELLKDAKAEKSASDSTAHHPTAHSAP